MTLIQLRYIVAVDTYRHFATAAEHCFVTQPTLSLPISTMEKDIPEKNTNIEGLDDSIFGAIRALKQLYSRMQKIEKQAKVHYYNNKEK